jgi:hypothetical protein
MLMRRTLDAAWAPNTRLKGISSFAAMQEGVFKADLFGLSR